MKTQITSLSKVAKGFILFSLAVSPLLQSCSKEEMPVASDDVQMAKDPVSSAYRCDAFDTKTLWAGQNNNAGTVAFSMNVDGDLIVSYNTCGNWSLVNVQFHIATSLAGIPKNKAGNLVPGQFQYQYMNLSGTAYEFSIPAASLPSGTTLYVAAKGNVTNGSSTETAFAQGSTVGNNWFMVGTITPVSCTQPSNGPGCSMSQGFWLSSPVSATQWTAGGGSVVIGGFTYTEAEARAIFAVNGGNWAKRLFCQVTAIKMSMSTINMNDTAAANLNTWYTSGHGILSDLGYKLTPNNLPTYSNVNAGTIAGQIGDWINANHCD